VNYLGFTCVVIGTKIADETEIFQPEKAFMKLRARCTALGVDREYLTTESHTRTGLDGIEREEFVCIEAYRYKFSVSDDRRIEKSGLERQQRSDETCEASASETTHPAAGSHKIGDRVQCWRPFEHLHEIIVQRISCGKPVCTLADVYSCDDLDCVQLTDPAGQFRFRFGNASAWIDFGWYFILSSYAMVLLLVSAELSSRHALWSKLVVGSEVSFFLGLSLLLVAFSGADGWPFDSVLTLFAGVGLLQLSLLSSAGIAAVMCFLCIRYARQADDGDDAKDFTTVQVVLFLIFSCIGLIYCRGIYMSQ
jgi:hypothetical protein